MKNTNDIRKRIVMIEKGIFPIKQSISPKNIANININEAIKYTVDGNLKYIFLW